VNEETGVKARLPADEAAFARLRGEARRTARRDPVSGNVTERPRVTPAEPIRKLEELRSKTPESPRPKAAAPLAPTSEPDAGSVDEDIQALFFPVKR